MRKSDGTYTYFVPDIAYHYSKWTRGYERAITELGADHHGSLMRVKAGLQALDAGIPPGYPDYVLHQMVTVMRGGEEVKLSKRAGSYLTLRDLIDEAGRDATRWFLVARKPDSQLTFDIDLARSQSLDNPVYYVQLRARAAAACSGNWPSAACRSMRTTAATSRSTSTTAPPRRCSPRSRAGRKSSPPPARSWNRTWSRPTCWSLAQDFQSYYNEHQFLVEDANLRDARLALAAAARQVLANGLGLLGVNAPEAM